MTTLAMLALVAFATLGCDPTYAVAVDNRSDQPILVRRSFQIGGQPGTDVVIAGPNARWTIGAFGVGSNTVLQSVVVMNASCDILGMETIWESFSEGGVILIAPDLAVTFNGGGNPSGGDPVSPSADCIAAVHPLQSAAR